MKDWFHIQNIGEIDSPSLVLYEDRLMHNLRLMLSMVGGDSSRLMPHVKTNKMPKVIERMIGLGMTRFKAATIAEAEMAAQVGAQSVLLAHQPVGPKIQRLVSLIQHFPDTQFSAIVDNIDTLAALNTAAEKAQIEITFYIDINNGMNRSGIEVGPELDHLIEQIPKFPAMRFRGLHVYDGQIRNPDFQERKRIVERGMPGVERLFGNLTQKYPDAIMICGGTPSFTSHVTEETRICSPGTCVFWDWGYSEKLKEQKFKYAALLITRVVSKPTNDIVTVDLGHKSVAAENPIDKRVKFLNLSDYELLSQSEEHGILKVTNWNQLKVGDVLYGVPYHVCPTVNLHDDVSVITDGRKTDTWRVTARKRKITI